MSKSMKGLVILVALSIGTIAHAAGTYTGNNNANANANAYNKARRKPMAMGAGEMTAEERWSLSNVHLNGIYVSQGASSTSYSGMVNWAPAYYFTRELSVRLNIGATLLQGPSARKFNVFDYEFFGGWCLLPGWLIEAGAGAQTWVDNGGTRFAASGNFAWQPKEYLGGFLERVFVGYSRYFMPGSGADQFKLGVGIAM